MKPAKCTTCGANIEVDESSDAGICPYCHTAYVTEKAIANYITNVTNNATTIVNNYYTNKTIINNAQNTTQQNKTVTRKRIKPRPRIDFMTAVILLFMFIVPGVIYIGYVKYNQYQWDKKHPDKVTVKPSDMNALQLRAIIFGVILLSIYIFFYLFVG